MSRLSYSLLLLSTLVPASLAHMSIWTKAMYGVGPNFDYTYFDPVAPLGPDWDNRDDWWFRGPGFRNLPPQDGAVAELVAGGSWTVEIACHVAWTSFGVATIPRDTLLDACPGNPGAYHSGDPGATDIDRNLLSGCALGIADVDDINDVTLENLAIFSVNHKCVQQRYTTFKIPAKMPACTGSKCICGWFWLANNGTGNFYMTAFDCKITNVAADATPIAPPQNPVWCDKTDTACMAKRKGGSKRPLYAYNSDSNIVWKGNYDRPGYHANWGFPIDGAQTDIFLPAAIVTTTTTTTVAATSSSSSSSSASPSSSPSSAVPTTTSSSATTTQAPSTTTTTTSTTTTTTRKAFDTSSSGNVAAGGSVSSTSTSTQAVPTASVYPNLALKATVIGSTSRLGSPGKRVVDGFVDGYKEDGSGIENEEWVSYGQKAGAWVSLSWKKPITFNQLVLFDRPNLKDQITSASILLDSGKTLTLSKLKNDGTATYFNTTSITTSFIKLLVLETSRTTTNVGLSELEIYNVDPATLTGTLLTPGSIIKNVTGRKNLIAAREAPANKHPRDFSSIAPDYAPSQVQVKQPIIKRNLDLTELAAEGLFE